MNLFYFSIVGLTTLYLVSNITSLVFGITNNRFYALFHFLGGTLATLLFLSITGGIAVSILLTLLTGIFWEIYEYLLWKYLLKRKKFKPQRQDTINDFFLDFLGAVFAVLLVF